MKAKINKIERTARLSSNPTTLELSSTVTQTVTLGPISTAC